MLKQFIKSAHRFIKNNFDKNVVNAYESLIPCAYKSDLWRYCILYIHGGIYLDIKYKCVNGFKLSSITKETFVRDRPNKCVYTALIATLPKNKIMLKCINQILWNVKNKYYGENALYPTGPRLLGSFFEQDTINTLHLKFTGSDKINKNWFGIFGKHFILVYYAGYREEQDKYKKFKTYGHFWSERNIYK